MFNCDLSGRLLTGQLRDLEASCKTTNRQPTHRSRLGGDPGRWLGRQLARWGTALGPPASERLACGEAGG